MGHQGIVKTKRFISSRLWFPGIDSKVEEKVKICKECQFMNQRRNYEPLRPSEMPRGPWQEVSADFFGPMPDGSYWFVNSCDYSKRVSVTRLSSVSSDHIDPILIKLFTSFGIPLFYKTDNGAPFRSHNLKSLSKDNALLAQSNRTAETVMRMLNKPLKIAKLKNKKPDIALDEFLAVYHDTPHSATGVAPNILMFGRAKTSGLPYLERVDFLAYQSECHKQAREEHKAYCERMKKQFDKQMKVKECPLRSGDKVLFKRDAIRKDMSHWDPNPFTITAVKGSLVTANRIYPRQQSISRNSFCFKLFRGQEENESLISEQTIPNTHSKTTPESLELQPVAEFGDQQPAIEYTVQTDELQANEADQMSQEVQGIDEQVSNKQTRKKGRPLKEESEKIEIERQEKLRVQKETNPQLEPQLDLHQEDHEVPLLP